MSSDTQENLEHPEKPLGPKLSPEGIHAMQGHAEQTRESSVAESDLTDTFTDGKGRDLTMKTYPSGDQYFVRVYDNQISPHLPDHATFADAGRANLHIERDAEGQVTKALLQDIDTTPSYREAGTGSRMLVQCEEIATQNSAAEIYGVPENDQARRWFEHQGYQTRENGRGIYKNL